MADGFKIRYRNTDLDLVAPISLAPLISYLESVRVSPMMPTLGEDGNWYVAFNTDESFEEPDPNIAAMLSAIESATGTARDCWDACTKREFNVGYDCGDEPWSFSQAMSNNTLRRIADRGATFCITLYSFREAPAIHSNTGTDT